MLGEILNKIKMEEQEKITQHTRAFAYVNHLKHTTVDGMIRSEEELRNFLRQPIVANLITRNRNGEKGCKEGLPAIIWQGLPVAPTEPNSRLQRNMVSNGLYLIDLDHIGEAEDDKWTALKVAETIQAYSDFELWNVRLMFITPSGRGLKIVAEMDQYDADIRECQKAFVQHFTPCERWFDLVNIDFSRLAFCPLMEEVIFLDKRLFEIDEDLFQAINKKTAELSKLTDEERARIIAKKSDSDSTDRAELNDNELEDYKNILWRETKVTVGQIVREWTMYRGEQLGIIVNGKPFKGEVHSLHYNIIRDVRNICDNNPAIITALLPSFGHSYDEIFAQAKKVCSYNTNGRIPYNLWQFMMSKGYVGQTVKEGNEPDNDEDEDENPLESPWAPLLAVMPELPPIIKEWVNAAPTELKIPTIAVLLEMLGTLTSYVEADYFDGFPHTTEFMSVISAPPAAGKSFIKRFDYLHSIIQNRESLIEARERLYDSFMNTKSDNRDGKEKPQLCKRFLEAKFSEVQLFTQAFENHGLHLHTACTEIDTFGRNVRGISDLLRIAWDNDKTGQQFRSTNTFKGRVALYWNVLLTGTPERIRAFFNNVQDGLITRITMTPIYNSDFAPYYPWRKIPQKTLERHFAIINRFDEQTYMDPLDEPSLANCDKYKNLQEFDKNVQWRYRVRPRIKRDLSYTWMPLRKWLEQVRKESRKAADDAMYVFSKRSANKGFRAALVANELWADPQGNAGKQKVLDFGMWWAQVEHFGTNKEFGPAYNEAKRKAADAEFKQKAHFGVLFEMLPKKFKKVDLEEAVKRTNIASGIYYITHMWIEDGLIKKTTKNEWEKV